MDYTRRVTGDDSESIVKRGGRRGNQAIVVQDSAKHVQRNEKRLQLEQRRTGNFGKSESAASSP